MVERINNDVAVVRFANLKLGTIDPQILLFPEGFLEEGSQPTGPAVTCFSFVSCVNIITLKKGGFVSGITGKKITGRIFMKTRKRTLEDRPWRGLSSIGSSVDYRSKGK